MNNKLFLYYSNSGNGDLIADSLKEKDFDIVKVEPKKPLGKLSFFSIMKGGFLAGVNHKSKIKELNINLNSYEKVVIGSPIWNAKLACPINTVLANFDLTKINDLAFVLYSGSGSGKKAVKKINKLYPNAKIFLLKEPKANVEELKKLNELF